MRALARRQRHVEHWHAVNRLLTLIVFLVTLGAMGLSFFPILNKTKELRETLAARKQELRAQILLQKKRTREVRLLQSDPAYLETIARDKLDLMKPGEIIFRLHTKK